MAADERRPYWLSKIEFNGVLAALRLLQAEMERGVQTWDEEILTCGGEQQAITPDQIDALCEEMNTRQRDHYQVMEHDGGEVPVKGPELEARVTTVIAMMAMIGQATQREDATADVIIDRMAEAAKVQCRRMREAGERLI